MSIKSIVLAATTLVLSTNIYAVTLTFDDVPSGSIQDGYGGMPPYQGFNFSTTLHWIDLVDSPSWNYGAHDTLSVDNNTGYRALIEFDLGRMPPGAMITTARLELYNTYTQRQGNIPIHRLSTPWAEGTCQGTGCTADGATWDSTDGVMPWNMPGGDYVNTPVSTSSLTDTDTWHGWNITELVQDWIDGTHPNYGILLASDPGADGEFASSDHANINWHPRLIIDYACANSRRYR